MAELALLVTVAGLLVLIAGFLMGHGRRSLSFALDFWLGAGLLRLSHTGEWSAIATAGIIVVLRHFLAKEVSSSPPASPRRRGSIWQAWRRAAA